MAKTQFVLNSGCRPTDQRLRYLYSLQLADGGSECTAFVCVVCSTVQGRLSDTKRLRRNADPSTV